MALTVKFVAGSSKEDAQVFVLVADVDDVLEVLPESVCGYLYGRCALSPMALRASRAVMSAMFAMSVMSVTAAETPWRPGRVDGLAVAMVLIVN